MKLDFNYVQHVSCFVVGGRDSYLSGGSSQYCIAIEEPTLTLDRIVSGMLKNEACRHSIDLRKRYAEKVFAVLRLVAIALQNLHSSGIVHGSISPGCCGKFDDSWKLLGAMTMQQVGDPFDCARFGGSVPPEAVEPQSSAAALERQCTFRTNIGVSTSIDIWGFGKLAYDVLVGSPLIKFDAGKDLRQDHQALLKIMHWSALDLVEAKRCMRHAGVPEPGVDLIAKCLAQEPSSRPSSMKEILCCSIWRELGRPEASQQEETLHEC